MSVGRHLCISKRSRSSTHSAKTSPGKSPWSFTSEHSEPQYGIVMEFVLLHLRSLDSIWDDYQIREPEYA